MDRDGPPGPRRRALRVPDVDSVREVGVLSTAGDKHRTSDLGGTGCIARAERGDACRSSASSGHGAAVEEQQITGVIVEAEAKIDLDERIKDVLARGGSCAE